MTNTNVSTKLWTRNFLLLLLAIFLVYGSNSLLSPLVPLRVTDLGGSSALAGILLAVLSAIAFILRPVAGRMVDSSAPSRIAGLGALFVGLGSLGWLAPGLIVPFAAQAVIGFGWAGVAPGGQTLCANLAPSHRRGEASGYYQAALRAGSAFIPAFGLWLLGVTNFTVVFLVATLGAGLSAAAMSAVREGTAPTEKKADRTSGLVDRGALLPSSLILLMMLIGSAVSSFLPLYAREQHIEGVATVFLISGIVGFLAAASFGGISDRIGRAAAISISFAMAIIGLLTLSQAENIVLLLIGSSIYAASSATMLPAIMAMVMDRAQSGRVGAAQATFAAAIQLGSMAGSLTTGFIIDLIGFSYLYFLCIIPMLIGLGILGFNWRPIIASTPATTEPAS